MSSSSPSAAAPQAAAAPPSPSPAAAVQPAALGPPRLRRRSPPPPVPVPVPNIRVSAAHSAPGTSPPSTALSAASHSQQPFSSADVIHASNKLRVASTATANSNLALGVSLDTSTHLLGLAPGFQPGNNPANHAVMFLGYPASLSASFLAPPASVSVASSAGNNASVGGMRFLTYPFIMNSSSTSVNNSHHPQPIGSESRDNASGSMISAAAAAASRRGSDGDFTPLVFAMDDLNMLSPATSVASEFPMTTLPKQPSTSLFGTSQHSFQHQQRQSSQQQQPSQQQQQQQQQLLFLNMFASAAASDEDLSTYLNIGDGDDTTTDQVPLFGSDSTRIMSTTQPTASTSSLVSLSFPSPSTMAARFPPFHPTKPITANSQVPASSTNTTTYSSSAPVAAARTYSFSSLHAEDDVELGNPSASLMSTLLMEAMERNDEQRASSPPLDYHADAALDGTAFVESDADDVDTDDEYDAWDDAAFKKKDVARFSDSPCVRNQSRQLDAWQTPEARVSFLVPDANRPHSLLVPATRPKSSLSATMSSLSSLSTPSSMSSSTNPSMPSGTFPGNNSSLASRSRVTQKVGVGGISRALTGTDSLQHRLNTVNSKDSNMNGDNKEYEGEDYKFDEPGNLNSSTTGVHPHFISSDARDVDEDDLMAFSDGNSGLPSFAAASSVGNIKAHLHTLSSGDDDGDNDDDNDDDDDDGHNDDNDDGPFVNTGNNRGAVRGLSFVGRGRGRGRWRSGSRGRGTGRGGWRGARISSSFTHAAAGSMDKKNLASELSSSVPKESSSHAGTRFSSEVLNGGDDIAADAYLPRHSRRTANSRSTSIQDEMTEVSRRQLKVKIGDNTNLAAASAGPSNLGASTDDAKHKIIESPSSPESSSLTTEYEEDGQSDNDDSSFDSSPPQTPTMDEDWAPRKAPASSASTATGTGSTAASSLSMKGGRGASGGGSANAARQHHLPSTSPQANALHKAWAHSGGGVGSHSGHGHGHGANRTRDYQCNVCLKWFLRRQDLRRHEVTHSKVKAFQCPLGCGTTFGRSDALSSVIYPNAWSLPPSLTAPPAAQTGLRDIAADDSEAVRSVIRLSKTPALIHKIQSFSDEPWSVLPQQQQQQQHAHVVKRIMSRALAIAMRPFARMTGAGADDDTNLRALPALACLAAMSVAVHTHYWLLDAATTLKEYPFGLGARAVFAAGFFALMLAASA
ncbi:hypothetical protein HDU84_002979 [Entophlyctis sp. JEL0112]|nr:hypothetical protein HDU84_002979 [Entophlyctis sp. JEL0112]